MAAKNLRRVYRVYTVRLSALELRDAIRDIIRRELHCKCGRPRLGGMNRIGRLIIVVTMLGSVAAFAEQHSADEKDVWSLEDSYWQYVKANDFEHYLTLWDANFVGWPLSSPEPAGKGQITEWITAHTSKGETLKAYDVERLKAYFGDRYATVTYRVHMTWTDKKGTAKNCSGRETGYVNMQTSRLHL